MSDNTADSIQPLADEIVALCNTSAYDDMSWAEIDRALVLASHEVKIRFMTHGTSILAGRMTRRPGTRRNLDLLVDIAQSEPAMSPSVLDLRSALVGLIEEIARIDHKIDRKHSAAWQRADHRCATRCRRAVGRAGKAAGKAAVSLQRAPRVGRSVRRWRMNSTRQRRRRPSCQCR
jgi:hypothetical protein